MTSRARLGVRGDQVLELTKRVTIIPSPGEQTGPAEIDRDSRQRTLSVIAYPAGRPLGKVTDDLHAAFDGSDWGTGYTLKFEGMQKEMGVANHDLVIALISVPSMTGRVLVVENGRLLYSLPIDVSRVKRSPFSESPGRGREVRRPIL